MLMAQDDAQGLRRALDAAIEAAHIGGKYMSINPAVIDHHMPPGQLLALQNELVLPAQTVVELEQEVPEYERSHRFRIGLRSAPAWSDLLDSTARRTADQKVSDAWYYSDVAVSRLGPFWYGSWSKVCILGGRAVGERCEAPDQEPWDRVNEHTRATMRRFGLLEIDHETSEIRVPRIDTTGAWFLGNEARKAPTVYECLISPLY